MCRARRSEPAAYHTRRRRRAARPRIAPRRRPHDPPAPAHIGPIVIVIVRIGIAIDHRIPRSAVVIAAAADRILAGHLIEKGLVARIPPRPATRCQPHPRRPRSRRATQKKRPWPPAPPGARPHDPPPAAPPPVKVPLAVVAAVG